MRRAAKWIGGILVVLVALPVLLLVAANTQPGRDAIERLTPRLTGDTVRLSGLSGRFPDALRVARIELRDPHGDYATIDNFLFDWSPLQLLHRRIMIDRLEAAHVEVIRAPALSSSSGSSGLPAPVTLRALTVTRLDIGAPLAGTAATVSLNGSGELVSPTEFNGNLDVHQFDGGGRYEVTGSADAAQLHAQLHASEPARGLISQLAGMPELGAVTVDATLEGPRKAVATRLNLTAGELHATVGGIIDLEHDAADLTVSAGAPAMQPRPDIGWQAVTVDAHVHGPFIHPDATGHLQIDALTAAGAGIGRLTADIAGNAGQLRLDGEATGLQVPGPDADLLAADPLTIQADARLDAPDRPVHVVLRHRLFTAEINALTGAERSLSASLRLADLAPVGALAQIPMQGGLALDLHAAIDGDTITLSADGTVGITGGQPQASALVGEDGRLSLAATLHGTDLTLSQLQFSGRAVSLEASGRVATNQVDMSWALGVSDLHAAQPNLSGRLNSKGTLGGATDNLAMTADINGDVAAKGLSSGALTARIEASGLPLHPSGRITVQGDLIGAPIDVAVAMRGESDGFAIDIERANWKSLEAGGALHLPTATMLPVGDMRVTMTRLADLVPLIGRPIAGSVRASLTAAAGMPGPTVDARFDGEGLEMSGLGGALHASAAGPIDALAVKLAAALPNLHRSPARLDAAATVDAANRTVSLASLQANWHEQTLRLLAPARIGFVDGVTIDRLRLGLRQAVLDVSGRAGATLEITASLRDLPTDLIGADGSVRSDARITGTSARPTGKIQLTGTGLRLRGGPGGGLPPASVTATADLNGTDARIDARATAGSSHVSLTGRAPLGAAGSLDLRAGGLLDLALLDPILAAGGQRVRGEVTLNATITGTVAAPNVSGNARLAGGEVQDFTNGLHLRDIVAQVDGAGNTLRIAQLSAKAGQGTIAGSGSLGVMAPGMPVNLTITARNAQPLASDLITVVLDADLTLRGEALGQLAIDGRVKVQRADIRIPERMPSAIAVLPVRQPGAKPAPPPSATSVIALNITLEAPQQVSVRGRGLDVEFGGSMKIGGTATAPSTVGGLELRRGSLSLAGRTLDFAEGRISFNGGSVTDPALRLVANSTNGNVTATLTIGGTAQAPTVTLTSVPPLPQDEVLANLLFGTGTGKLGALEVAGIASSLATLTGTGGVGDPLDKVRQGLGLDRLSVSSGANGSPALEAGRYIAPRVFLGAKQSASGNTQASVQVDITKGLKLEATAGSGGGSATGTAGQSNGSSVGLTYQFDY